MSFIKTHFSALGVYYKRSLKWPLIISAAVFFLLAIITSIVFSSKPELAVKIIEYFMDSVGEGILDDSGNISWLGLLLNNLRACLSSVLMGFIPFFFIPAFSMAANAGIIGAMLGYYGTLGVSIWRLVVFGLLPHGIFELPALFISFAMGISLCLTMSRGVIRLDGAGIKQEVLNIVRVYIMNIIPLLILAALVESFITPQLMTMAMGM